MKNSNTLINLELSDQQLSVASRLFSPTVFREFARNGRSVTFVRIVNELLSLEMVESNSLVRDLYDSAYSLLLSKKYRNEFIYKSMITRKILLGKHSLNTAVLLNEFRVHDCKADVAVINGTSNVYEIKTERDSLQRLNKQICTYQSVFANVNVVVGSNHLNSVLKTTPDSVGVLLLNHRNHISTHRKAVEFCDNISTEAIFNSIRLSESKKILENIGIEIPNVPNTKTYLTLKSLFKDLSSEEAHKRMVSILKLSRNHSKVSTFLDSLPKSLHSSALSTQISKKDRVQLLAALDTPLNSAMNWC